MIKNTIDFKSPNKLGKRTEGFTLIELMISTLILSFVLLSLVKLYGDISYLSVRPEYRETQTMLAQELIEEIRSKRFDELSAQVGGDWSTTLGTDTGEDVDDKSTFDDVDDYNGWTEDVTAPYAGFSRSASVFYVEGDDLNTAAAGGTTDLKHVTVTISNDGVPDLVIDTVVSVARSSS